MRFALVLCALSSAWAVPSVVVAQRPASARPTPVSAPRRSGVSIRVDAVHRHVAYQLQAGLVNAENPELNFNGAALGEEELRVPVGWTVEVFFVNVGQAAHSARLMPDAEIAVTAGAAAVRGAETPNAHNGSPPGAQHRVRFVASREGRFRLACAVNAHGYAGMWVRLVVDPRLATASLVRVAAVAR